MPPLYEKRNHVGILTFSRLEVRNAWCEAFYEALRLRPDRRAWREMRAPQFKGE